MDIRPSPSTEEPHDRLFVARSDSSAFARVIGRGSYKVSPALKQFSARMLDKGITRLEVDLENCLGMDSTFMGTLAGISQRQQAAGGDPVVLTHVTPKLSKLMQTLGLDRLVQVEAQKPASPQTAEPSMSEAETPDASPLESAEHVLEAHQTLADLSAANQAKFQDCLVFLREDVQKRQD